MSLKLAKESPAGYEPQINFKWLLDAQLDPRSALGSFLDNAIITASQIQSRSDYKIRRALSMNGY